MLRCTRGRGKVGPLRADSEGLWPWECASAESWGDHSHRSRLGTPRTRAGKRHTSGQGAGLSPWLWAPGRGRRSKDASPGCFRLWHLRVSLGQSGCAAGTPPPTSKRVPWRRQARGTPGPGKSRPSQLLPERPIMCSSQPAPGEPGHFLPEPPILNNSLRALPGGPRLCAQQSPVGRAWGSSRGPQRLQPALPPTGTPVLKARLHVVHLSTLTSQAAEIKTT